jgi:hypothetical protein
VRSLLMGGQACVLYGAAEFSRDTDIALVADADNLQRLRAALGELQADCIAVPPFEADYLERGHAVHFRCRHPEAQDSRLDVMAVMRGVAPFQELWPRRMTLEGASGLQIELMGLPDLVQAKRTQRDKDWPMIRRLVEAHYLQYHEQPTDSRVEFWLKQSRTPAMLLELAKRHSEATTRMSASRPLLAAALAADAPRVAAGLEDEEQREREADRQYWLPLKAELESLRRQRRSHGSPEG